MNLWNMLRRARIRGLSEGLVQKGRVEVNGEDGRDDVERFQDYGLAANAVDGEGLRIEVGGHTFVLRMDRLAERPELAPYEVSVWHKEGHKVTLRAGRLVEVECDTLAINASQAVKITTPTMTVTGNQVVVGNQQVSGVATAATVVGVSDVKIGEASVKDHDHGNVSNGPHRTAKFGV